MIIEWESGLYAQDKIYRTGIDIDFNAWSIIAGAVAQPILSTNIKINHFDNSSKITHFDNSSQITHII